MFTDIFEIQTKLRQGQPAYLKEWLRGIVATASSRNRIGVVIWKETGTGKPDDEALVVLRLKDWTDLHGRPEEARTVDAVDPHAASTGKPSTRD